MGIGEAGQSLGIQLRDGRCHIGRCVGRTKDEGRKQNDFPRLGINTQALQHRGIPDKGRIAGDMGKHHGVVIHEGTMNEACHCDAILGPGLTSCKAKEGQIRVQKRSADHLKMPPRHGDICRLAGEAARDMETRQRLRQPIEITQILECRGAAVPVQVSHARRALHCGKGHRIRANLGDMIRIATVDGKA